jgi:hypothetical protein
MAAYRDVIRAWFALCILRIVVKLAVIKGYSRNFASRVRFAIFIFPRTEPFLGERNAERTLSSRQNFGSILGLLSLLSQSVTYLPAEHTQAANALAV